MNGDRCCADRQPDALGRFESRLAMDARFEQREFLTADPAEDIGAIQVHSDCLRQFAQRFVADRMTIPVVDLLEFVDVKHEQCAMPGRKRLYQRAHKTFAIEDSRQSITPCALIEMAISLL